MSLRLRRALSLGVILAFVGAGCSDGGPVKAAALFQLSKSLRSDAAEGALLALDVAAGKATRIYTQAHATDLYLDASQGEALLKATKTRPALEPLLGWLVVLAGQVSADLKRLGNASRDEARSLARELLAAAQTSQEIGEGLK